MVIARKLFYVHIYRINLRFYWRQNIISEKRRGQQLRLRSNGSLRLRNFHLFWYIAYKDTTQYVYTAARHEDAR